MEHVLQKHSTLWQMHDVSLFMYIHVNSAIGSFFCRKNRLTEAYEPTPQACDTFYMQYYDEL